jgi:taurine dioxygenase
LTLTFTPSGQACRASVTGVDLSQSLAEDTIAAIRSAWLAHHVLAFPDQLLGDDDLERFTRAFGGFGEDPFIAPIPGRKHIIAVERRADETSSLFAETWHTDWSFQTQPPAGTCLYGLVIPPVGGDTLFANQHAALEAMPLLTELYQWQSQEAFQYRHRWQPQMLVMWDNRSLLHAATGGYAGHHRLLHRTTIAASG